MLKQRVKMTALLILVTVIGLLLISCTKTPKPEEEGPPTTPPATAEPSSSPTVNAGQIDKQDIDAVIGDYVHKKAPQEYASCDEWFTGFDRIETIENGTKYTVIGIVSMVGFREADGILEFPSAGGGGPAIVELEKQQEGYIVTSYTESMSPKDHVQATINKLLSKKKLKQLMESRKAGQSVEQQYWQWVRKKYGETPKVKIGNYEVNYAMIDPTTPNLIDGLLRKSLIETGLKFLDGCSKGDMQSLKPLCTPEMWEDIQAVTTSIKKSTRGGDIAMSLSGNIKGFYQVTDPIYNEKNLGYDVTIGYQTNDMVVYAYMTLKSTQGIDLLVDRIMINP